MTDFKYIGADVPREDAREKSTGLAQYATDFHPDGCLQVRIFRSTRPHARIKSLEVEKARRVSGVEAVVTGQDYKNVFWGSFLYDQNIFAVD